MTCGKWIVLNRVIWVSFFSSRVFVFVPRRLRRLVRQRAVYVSIGPESFNLFIGINPSFGLGSMIGRGRISASKILRIRPVVPFHRSPLRFPASPGGRAASRKGFLPVALQELGGYTKINENVRTALLGFLAPLLIGIHIC